MYKNGDIYPKNKKITLRFTQGDYTAILRDGDSILDETKFSVAAKNIV